MKRICHHALRTIATCQIEQIFVQYSLTSQLEYRFFTEQPSVAQIVPALSVLGYQCTQLVGQAMLHLDRSRLSCNCCPSHSYAVFTIYGLPKQKSLTITAGFSPAQPDRNRSVVGWFPGRYCFTHGERFTLIKFLRNMLIIKDKSFAFFVCGKFHE